ncbi:MerR family transcriptional regulator [Agromyces sp. H3Y2-19a]|jgi:MerR family transcriptional regulator/heat shock protein HspR|uniref:MerR family transcriptional regulator n=1 Tax=Agromyces TaxID=33877 RepID=UPI001E63343B|nr:MULTISPECIES: MerR family transcriptional regulator [Agromyces]MCD5344840.1 MerR family transcriptional regulator [Agromyces sp. S2-1-8]MDF0513977.1 MerR family transcriptional regulator [Agromyces chromiiresistens]
MNDRAGGMPLYSIAVAAQLVELQPATLRLYEEKGLLTPARTEGGTRRYSEDDLALVRQVVRLQGDGINLAGIGRVLALEQENDELRRRLGRRPRR